MKTLYTLLVVFVVALGSALAQCTPNDSINQSGIYYDDAAPFCVNEPYNEVFQIALVNDTSLFGQTFTIDSLEVVSVTNIPTGISYACPTLNCKTYNTGGDYSHNCMLVSGTPSMEGEFIMEVTTRIYGDNPLTGLPAQIDIEEQITLNVSNCISSIGEDLTTNELLNIYPQPSTADAKLQVNLTSTSMVEITVNDMLGQEVARVYNGSMSAGSTNLELSNSIRDLISGMYFINILVNGTESQTKRLLID